MTLVQLTGELTWLDSHAPKRVAGMGDNDTGGLDPEAQQELRDAALAAILAWDGGRPVSIASPSDDLVVRMLSVAMAEPVPAEYGPMLGELSGASLLPPQSDDTSASGEYNAVIVGAGLSGLCAGVYLKQLGVPFTILERHENVGGTWLENHYPGVGVDSPNHLYSFSFAPYEWSHYFARGSELKGYLEQIADDFDLRSHIRFNTEVSSARYDIDDQSWVVDYRDHTGATGSLTSRFCISAVGVFNPPVVPKIPGLSDFEGPIAHTALWPDSLDLSGKHVAVLGSGASSMQLVPAIADSAASVTIFQRSKQWIAPYEQFGREVSDPMQFLFRELPHYRTWYRLRLAWTWNDRFHESMKTDDTWPYRRSINAANDGHRRFFTRYFIDQLKGHEQLLADVLPDYPPFGKRMLLDHGWFDALKRDDVALITESVDHIDPSRVVTKSGRGFDVDVLVLATGFDVLHFIPSIEVTGRSGALLSESWGTDNPTAYLGTVVPDFPNFFVLYGPNLQPGHGGSIMLSIEMQMRYVCSVIAQMREKGFGSAECRREPFAEYNAMIDDAHSRMVWTHTGMSTYTRNTRGRVVANSPLRNVDYWEMTKTADLADFDVEAVSDNRLVDQSVE
jgi:4-hydroxyacetophenone monooxygenase